MSRALAISSQAAYRVSTLPTWCGVKAASGYLRRWSSTRSRSAPGRVAGARAGRWRRRLDCPPSLGGEGSRAVSRGGEGDVQVSRRRGPCRRLSRGGLGNGRDGPGGLGGHSRVRPWPGAGVRLLLLGGAVRRDRGGLAGVGRLGGGLPVAGGLGGRRLVGRDCRGGGRPGVGDAGPTALDPGRGTVLLVREQGLPGGGGADADAGGDDRDGRPGGFGRQGGQGGRCRGCRPPLGQRGAGAGVVAVLAARRAAGGGGGGVRAMMVTPFLFSGAFSVFSWSARVFSGRLLLCSRRLVKRLRDRSRCRF